MPMAVSKHWWLEDKDRLADSICAVVQSVDENQQYRRDQHLKNLRLYTGTSVDGLGAAEYTGENAQASNFLSLNVVECVVEAAKAMITTQRPKIRFITEGGSRSDRKKAEALTKFVSGQFYMSEHYPVSAKALGDGIIFGTGIEKIRERNKRVFVERVVPDELLVDDLEGRYSDPRCAYHVKDVERSVLLKLWPDMNYDINNASKIRDEVSVSAGVSDPITIIESWRLPSEPGADDGRRVVSLSNVVLVDEVWRQPTFPLNVFRWIDLPLGFYGKGIPEQLRGLQIELTLLLRKIQRMMSAASSKIFIRKGGKLNPAKLDEKEWGVNEYTGDAPPVFATIAAIAPEYYVQAESLYRKAFEITGVSMMTASGTVSGDPSGRAVTAMNDVQSQRFLHVQQAVDKFHVDAGARMIDIARDVAKSDGDYEVIAEDGNRLERLNWSRVDPGKMAYRMKAWPASQLPDTPGGKIAAVQELLQIDPRLQPYSVQLLNMPDLEAASRRLNASVDIVEKIVDQILDGGEMIPPEPYMNLQLGITIMQHAYLEAKAEEVDESRLDPMRRWMDMAYAMLTQAQAAMAMQQPQPSPLPSAPGSESGTGETSGR